jgi:coenzyme PQQ synthesis protein D (PqqD)
VSHAHHLLARREQVIFQQVEGKQVLLNLADGQYYALDEVGARIWELCDGTRSVSDVVVLLADEFDAPADVIESDTLELLEELIAAQLLVEAT